MILANFLIIFFVFPFEIKKLKKFETIQKHDQIKNNYCKEKGINLLRIKYDENVEEKLTDYFQNL